MLGETNLKQWLREVWRPMKVISSVKDSTQRFWVDSTIEKRIATCSIAFQIGFWRAENVT